MKGSEEAVMRWTKIGIFIFALIALFFSELISDQIALLARVSFAGTATMAPMIILGILSDRKISPAIIYISGVGLLVFLLSLAGIVPDHVAGMRMDLLVFTIHSLVAVVSYLAGKKAAAV